MIYFEQICGLATKMYFTKQCFETCSHIISNVYPSAYASYITDVYPICFWQCSRNQCSTQP
jgi:hypothetical protein